MRTSGFKRFTLSYAALALLVGCGGSQPIGAPGAMPQSPAIVSSTGHRTQYKSLYSFKGHSDGASPLAGLIALSGTLYGTTAYGGANNFGTVFAVSTSGAENVLHSFGPDPDGQNPIAALFALNGTLYGTTGTGGDGTNNGTVFTVTPSGSESILYSFGNMPDGVGPWAGLNAVKGKLYGTTLYGGSGFGTVFSLSTSGTESVLYGFKYEPDGAFPVAPLVEVNGKLYGTTSGGGDGSCGGCGTVFEVSKSGSEEVLYSFKGAPDGASPGLGGLILVHGALYGTTESGGSFNEGTVFKITLSGTESVVYSFKGLLDGAQPDATLLDFRGQLYGTTVQGGIDYERKYTSGTVFRVSTSGKESVLYRFKGKPDGAAPETQFTDINGILYGTTAGGGANGSGTVFSIDP